MTKTEMLKTNSNEIREEKIQINFMDMNKTKESFRDEKNNQNEIYKEKKIKKVKFMEPMFVNIIEVESYKKYNEENTSKVPYFYTNNKNDDKANVMCSCFIV